MGDLVKNLVIWTIIAVVIMSLFTGVGGRNAATQEFNYTDFMQQVQTGQVEQVTISGEKLLVHSNQVKHLLLTAQRLIIRL